MLDYCASKFAVRGLNESLRMQLHKAGSSVRCTMVSPFYIDTGVYYVVQTGSPLPLPPIALPTFGGEKHPEICLWKTSGPCLKNCGSYPGFCNVTAAGMFEGVRSRFNLPGLLPVSFLLLKTQNKAL